MLGSDSSHYRDDYGYLTVHATSCEFWGGSIGGYVVGSYLTNCLMDRVLGGSVAGLPGNEWTLRNCTWRGGQFYMDRWWSPIPVSVRDCAFDDVTISVDDGQGATDYDYNAYLTNATRLDAGATHDVLLATNSFNFQSGPLGYFYLPTNGPATNLFNKGSTSATNVGLYHFTCTANQWKETNSIVDIGFHRVALNSSGLPVDTDGDGLPDYFEDRNGNGSWDIGESKWKTTGSGDPTDTDGDGVGDFLEFLLGRNPYAAGTTNDATGTLNLRRYTPLK